MARVVTGEIGQEAKVFERPRYIQNSFSVAFPRQLSVRRKANELEDRLKGQYVQPRVIPVPDDLDPEIPRVVFKSEHGYSQIIVSQINIVLNVNYSPEWQTEITKGRGYLLQRVPILFDLLDVLGEIRPYFCGLTTRVQMPCRIEDEALLDYLADLLLKERPVDHTHDILIRTTTVQHGEFFSNIAIQNYRSSTTENERGAIPRLPKEAVTEVGIQIVGDYNDRYLFNEVHDYFSSREIVPRIIDGGIAQMEKIIARFRSVT